MEGIKDKVAIVGMGCSKFGFNWNKNGEDMIIEAAHECFQDSGVEPKDIQAAWLGTLISNRTGRSLARALKLENNIPISRVENACATGSEALRNAAYAVAAGVYDLVLVVGFEKLKDLGYNVIPPTDSFLVGDGQTSPGMYALAATTYFKKYGIGRETLAKINVKNHHNGAMHPKAHFQKEITEEQSLTAPIVAWPLGLYDCCPRTDGAAAAIICPARMATSFRDDYILIKGLGVATGTGVRQFIQGRDIIGYQENAIAAKRAYGEAGITNPLKEISLAQVHDCFSINELFSYEDLGFCPRGKAKSFIDDGVFELDGELPVNSDGGLKSFGHPQGASGLRMVYEIYKQIQGKADKPSRQIKNVSIGLTHNVGGVPETGGVSFVGIFGR
jgi:acetyl-CoA C-acetyltransferase